MNKNFVICKYCGNPQLWKRRGCFVKKFKNYVKVFTCNRIIVILQSILEFPSPTQKKSNISFSGVFPF